MVTQFYSTLLFFTCLPRSELPSLPIGSIHYAFTDGGYYITLANHGRLISAIIYEAATSEPFGSQVCRQRSSRHLTLFLAAADSRWRCLLFVHLVTSRCFVATADSRWRSKHFGQHPLTPLCLPVTWITGPVTDPSSRVLLTREQWVGTENRTRDQRVESENATNTPRVLPILGIFHPKNLKSQF